MAKYSQTGPLKVLVVDDHEVTSQHMIASLDRTGVIARRVCCGRDTLNSASQWLPHVVFMDMHLPDMDGLEVIRLLKLRWPPGASLPVFIAVSGEDPRRRGDELEQLGVSQALTKPVSAQQLRSIVSDLTGKPMLSGVSDEPQAKLALLFRSELETRLPELEIHLLNLNYSKASELVHQLIASCAMTAETRLESRFRLLSRVLNQSGRSSALAKAYFSAREEVHEYLRRKH
ncbi:response regulator [Pseudomonadota bacterium]